MKTLNKKVILYLKAYSNDDYLKFMKYVFPNALFIPMDDYIKTGAVSQALGSANLMNTIILFTGGSDVDPAQYNEKPSTTTMADPQRDKIEKKLFNFGRGHNSLNVGICRGAQFLTVQSRGKLIQHVTGHNSDHGMYLDFPESKTGTFTINTTSSHHQMMNPFVLPNNDYKLVGYSSRFMSDRYLGGEDEDVKIPIDFVEPEIVYYNRTKSLCIQGHPEYSTASQDYVDVCSDLIHHYDKD